MKARRKSDGEIIEVREWRGASDVIYSSIDMNQFYQASELDFNLGAESQCMNLSDVKQKIDAWMESHTEEGVYAALKKYGAVEDADTVIQGWVARDEDEGLFLYKDKPTREDGQPYGELSVWVASLIIRLDKNSFPDLTWESDPEPVEIIIKRKKK